MNDRSKETKVPSLEPIIRFYPELCIQCHGCETACKMWRNLPCGIKYRRVLNLWDGTYPKIKSKSLSLSCLHCTDPACEKACPVGAISKREDGRVLVDTDLCIGCKTCAKACPFGVPQFAKGKGHVMQKCDLCAGQPLENTDPPCVATCPGKALMPEMVTPEEKKACEAFVAAVFQLE